MKAKRKSNKKEKTAEASEMIGESPADFNVSPPPPAGDIVERSGSSDLLWYGGSAFIVVVATFLRFYDLSLKPFHHDEGVNGFFLKTLFNDGVYKYDPANYHGPTLYYISLAFSKVFGLETFSVRASVAIFGVLMVVLTLFLRRYLGTVGTLLAALFLAVSPGMVFISRYFIHEIFFVFLSLAVVVAVVFFIEKRRAGPFAIGWMSLILLVCFLPSATNLAAYLGGEVPAAVWGFRFVFFAVDAFIVYQIMQALLSWDLGRPIYLMLASASVSLMFSTKETAFITIGTLGIACGVAWVWRGILAGDLWRRRGFNILIGAHIVVGLALIYYRQSIGEAVKSLTDAYFSTFRPAEPFAFYSILILMAVAAAAWGLFLAQYRRGGDPETDEPAELTWPGFYAAIGDRRNAMLIAGAAILVFAYLFVLFFSSFFTYAEGIRKAFEAYAIWTKTGNKDHTQNGTFAYLKWGMKAEAPIFILSALGILIAMLLRQHRFALFTALWAGGLFLAYTIIPYKTPWLNLSFLMPMCLIAGYGVGQLLSSRVRQLRIAGGILAVVAVALLTYQAQQLNFVRYDDDDEPYVYAHTKRGFLDLVSEISRYADKSGKGKDATIEIVSPDYWPMTWYMNDYGKANFFGSLIDATTSEMIVAKKNDQDAAIIQKYATHYKFAGVYPLRPGVNLVLLVRNDIADAKDQDVSKVLEYKPVPGYTQ